MNQQQCTIDLYTAVDFTNYLGSYQEITKLKIQCIPSPTST